MICERITPEFPRAPIKRGARHLLDEAGAILGRRLVELLDDARAAVSVRFVPVSPSGTG